MPEPAKLREYYGRLADEALLEAYREGQAAYERDAWRVITWEIRKRGLSVDEFDATHTVNPSPGMAIPDQPLSRPLDATELEAAIAHERTQERDAVFWVVGGLVITGLTFMAASAHGGTYLIAWGPVVYGMVKAARAQARLKRLDSLRERLESADPLRPR